MKSKTRNNKNKNKPKRAPKKIINIYRNKPPKRKRRKRVPRRIQLVNYKNIKTSFSVIRTNSTGMTVKGCDLVYRVPDVELNAGHNVLAIIPSNPAYWTGTRIASIALGYQQFRPLQFTVHYVPTVSAVQQGNIFGGTLWNTNPKEENLQQTLQTSQGFISTQVFQGKSATVRCRSNLQYNLFNVSGEFSEKSNPFTYVAIAVGNFKEGERVNPGFFYVSYTYQFKNPIGLNTTFYTSGLIKYGALKYTTNTTIYTCSPKNLENKSLNMFTLLQINRELNGEFYATLNGEYINVPNDWLVWAFQNYESETSNPLLPITKELQFTHTMYYDYVQGGSLNANDFMSYQAYAFIDIDGNLRIYKLGSTADQVFQMDQMHVENGKVYISYITQAEFAALDLLRPYQVSGGGGGNQSEEYRRTRILQLRYRTDEYQTIIATFLSEQNKFIPKRTVYVSKKRIEDVIRIPGLIEDDKAERLGLNKAFKKGDRDYRIED